MPSSQSNATTEREAQLLREVAEARQELNDFVYIVSHDIKAPLRAIDSLAGWIASDYADQLDEEGQELITLLLSRVQRMNNLMDGLLQYSRVGRVPLGKKEINLQQLLPAIIESVAPPENITITVGNNLPVIRAELTRIEQIFENLLRNAIQYMDKSEGHITVNCVEAPDRWQFSVVDNGPGIDEKHFDKIFKIFQTLQPRDEVESSGVGLALVKKIVESYDGAIWVESEIGRGSTFHFTLPKEID